MPEVTPKNPPAIRTAKKKHTHRLAKWRGGRKRKEDMTKSIQGKRKPGLNLNVTHKNPSPPAMRTAINTHRGTSGSGEEGENRRHGQVLEVRPSTPNRWALANWRYPPVMVPVQRGLSKQAFPAIMDPTKTPSSPCRGQLQQQRLHPGTNRCQKDAAQVMRYGSPFSTDPSKK